MENQLSAILLVQFEIDFFQCICTGNAVGIKYILQKWTFRFFRVCCCLVFLYAFTLNGIISSVFLKQIKCIADCKSMSGKNRYDTHLIRRATQLSIVDGWNRPRRAKCRRAWRNSNLNKSPTHRRISSWSGKFKIGERIHRTYDIIDLFFILPLPLFFWHCCAVSFSKSFFSAFRCLYLFLFGFEQVSAKPNSSGCHPNYSTVQLKSHAAAVLVRQFNSKWKISVTIRANIIFSPMDFTDVCARLSYYSPLALFLSLSILASLV